MSEGVRSFRWGFFSAAGMVLGLVLVGTALRATIFLAFERESPLIAGTLGASLLFGGLFLWPLRAAVLRFFRSMVLGVTLMVFVAISIVLGVLVPQIDGFEDPAQRVTAESWQEDYEAFRWAEGYFLYHLTHLYGIGMPEATLPAPAVESLERFGRRYGAEEAKNRHKQMEAAFSGREKTAEIRAFIDEHDGLLRGAFRVATLLDFNRLYKSHWFASLLTLLFIAVACNTFRGDWRAWFTLRKVGWMTVHFGVMTLLAGGMVSNLLTMRGILHLDTRNPPTDRYWAWYDRSQVRRLPFLVKVDRFARRDWKTLEVHFLEERFSSKPPDITLWPGRVLELDWVDDTDSGTPEALRPRLRIEVEELHERAVIGTPRVWEAGAQDGASAIGPLAELEATDWRAAPAEDGAAAASLPSRALFLKPGPGSGDYHDPAWRFRLTTAFGPERDAALARLQPAAEDAELLGRLRMRLASGAAEIVAPIRLGAVVDAPGGYRVEVLEATASFRVDPRNPAAELRDPRPLREQYPRNPAVWVRITPPVDLRAGALEPEPERRPVIEALDTVSHGVQAGFRHSDLVLDLEWERWRSAGPPRFALSWDADGGAVLIDEEGDESPVRPGEPLALPGPTRVLARALYANAALEKRLVFSDPVIQGPRYDPSFYSDDPTGVVLRVVSDPGTPEEVSTRVEMASTDQGLAGFWKSPDGRFALHYFENERAFPFEWRSVLSFWEPGPNGKPRAIELGDESQREIRVNDYIHLGGWRFFQTNAIPELPTYSGIGVVYDPGIPFVLYGMYMIIAGTVLAFLVRPIAERRTRTVSASPGGGAQ